MQHAFKQGTAAVARALALKGHGQSVLGVEVQHMFVGAVEQGLARGIQHHHGVVAAAGADQLVVGEQVDGRQTAVQQGQIGQAVQCVVALRGARLHQLRGQRPGFAVAQVGLHQPQAVCILNAAAFILPRRLRRIAQVDAAATGEGAVGAGFRRQQPAAVGGDQTDGPVLALVLGAARLAGARVQPGHDLVGVDLLFPRRVVALFVGVGQPVGPVVAVGALDGGGAGHHGGVPPAQLVVRVLLQIL